MTHKVYCIAFTDGHSYVGKTRQESIESRVRAHRSGDPHHKNPCLRDRLQSGDPHSITLLWEGECATECDRMERQAIIAQQRPLNKVMISRGKSSPARHHSKRWTDYVGRKYERRDGRDYRCSWCREVLPSTRFTTDRRRSSGLASKCKPCMALKAYLMKRARKAVNTRKHASKAYYLAKRICRSNPARRDRWLARTDYTPMVRPMEIHDHEDEATKRIRERLRRAVAKARAEG